MEICLNLHSEGIYLPKIENYWIGSKNILKDDQFTLRNVLKGFQMGLRTVYIDNGLENWEPLNWFCEHTS